MFLQVTDAAIDYGAHCAGVLGSVAHEAAVDRVNDSWGRRDEDDGACWDGIDLSRDDRDQD